MAQRETVYHYPGPPELRLERWRATDGGRSWLQHALTPASGADGVVVICQRPDATILLAEHERPVIGATCLELPRGFGTVGSTPEGDGERELVEETGLSARSAEVLGRFHPDSGLLATRVAVVLCAVASEDQPRVADGELRGFIWRSPGEVERMIRDGAIVDGMTIAALAIWRAVGGGGRSVG